MLLELLSDFQISIPELGPGHGAHRAGRAADLEQHARADRGAQAPLPVPVARLPRARARARDRAAALARAATRPSRGDSSRSCTWCASSTSRSRRRSRSRSTGRARCSCSARRTSTPTCFRSTMSIIVKHRTDLDVVAERVGVRLGGPAERCARAVAAAPRARPWTARRRARRTAPAPRRGAARRGRCGRHLGAARRVRRAGRGVVDAASTTCARRWPRRWPSRPRTGACSSSSSTASSSALPRRRRCTRDEAGEGDGQRRGRRPTAPREMDLAQLRERIAAAIRQGDEARCATSPGWRSPPSGVRARARG